VVDEVERTPNLAIKVGVAAAIGAGAVITGMLLSRKGRNLIREAWQGRKRTRIEDRVLDAIWSDRALGAWRIDVKEAPEGMVELTGVVRSDEERERAAKLAADVKGVIAVENRIGLVTLAGQK